MERITKDRYYLDIASAVSRRSTCLRRRYGCVIVNDDIIISTGYNGNPRGEANCCDTGVCNRKDAERYAGYESCNAVHAEQNAIIAAQRKNMMGGTAYLACSEYNKDKDAWAIDSNPRPCNICLNMLKNSGIKEIVTESGRTVLC